MCVTDHDYKKLLKLTADISKIGLNWTAWEEVLRYFSSYVKNGKGAITVRQNDTGFVDLDNFYLSKTWNFDPELFASYRSTIYKNDVWTNIEWKYESEKLVIFSEHLPKSDLFKTPFYSEWLQPQGLTDGIAIQLFKAKNIRIVLNIFYDDDLPSVKKLHQHLRNVSPHLCQSAATHMKLLGIDSESEYVSQTAQLVSCYCFTPREMDVAAASIHLGTNAKVANELGITEGAVKLHIKSIIKKMGVDKKEDIVPKLLCFINPNMELISPIPSKSEIS